MFKKKAIVLLSSLFVMLSLASCYNQYGFVVTLEQLEQEAKEFGGGVNAISAGTNRSFAITADGGLWAWGYNSYYQLGDGTSVHRTRPTRIMDDVIAVSSSSFHGGTTAITSDGGLWTWGMIPIERLADGTVMDTLQRTDVPVRAMNDIIYVSAGAGHIMAINTDGELWTWGANANGRLGDGTTTHQYIPIHIMNDVVAVSAGGSHSMAIMANGELWGWGGNRYGQLGDGTTINQYLPIHIKDNIVAVSTGQAHTIAITVDGELWAWGLNRAGQLGDGTTINHYRPIKILDDVIDISVGNLHSAAITSDGILWMWGIDSRGQLGRGDSDDVSELQLDPVGIMENIVSVSVGHSHTMAITANGELWAWGSNFEGTLGDGTISLLRDRPVRVK